MVGILVHNLFNTLCLEILTNSSYFLRIENDPLESSCDFINNILHNLYLIKNISIKIYKKLKIFKMNCKVGSFRILP